MHHKNKIVEWLIFIFIFVLASCTHKQIFPTITTSWILPYDIDAYNTVAHQSYDGKHIIFGNFNYLNIETGELSHPLDGFLPENWTHTHFADRLLWSDKGNLLIVQTHGTDFTLPLNEEIVYKINLQNQTLSEGYDIGPIYSSSPFGERIIGNPLNLSTSRPQVYDLITEKQISLFQTYADIRNEQTAGDKLYLWEQSTNLPIAKINIIDPINFAGRSESQQIGYSLLNSGIEGEIIENTAQFFTAFESQPPNNVVNAIFDPSGDYIVLTKWECDPNDSNQCSKYPDMYYTDNVLDTVILLVDWRTGDEHELFRLSDIVSDHLIGSYTTWSMDGSTLLLWRQDAPPVVIKIEYH